MFRWLQVFQHLLKPYEELKALVKTKVAGRSTAEQPDLFDPGNADEAMPVRLKRIRLERGRLFGDVWLGRTLWRALRQDGLLVRLVPEGRESVPWATMAAVLLLRRHQCVLRGAGRRQSARPAGA